MRVALLENDSDQARTIASWLGKAGYPSREYDDAKEFLQAVARESYDLLIVDFLIPDLGGLEVINRYRAIASGGPAVMVVTREDEERNAVEALTVGADDYMCIPLRPNEFLARIRALGRRAWHRNLSDIEPFEIDTDKSVITRDGRAIQMTSREFDLALFLFQRRDQLISRNHILESIWGNDQLLLSRTIDTHISRLRKKLGLNGDSGWRLISVYRRGYSLQKVM